MFLDSLMRPLDCSHTIHIEGTSESLLYGGGRALPLVFARRYFDRVVTLVGLLHALHTSGSG